MKKYFKSNYDYFKFIKENKDLIDIDRVIVFDKPVKKWFKKTKARAVCCLVYKKLI